MTRILTHISIGVLLVSLLSRCGERDYRDENGNIDGSKVFSANCTSCHGENGALGASGAKNLQESTLSVEDIRHIVRNGSANGQMMPFKDMLSDEEIAAVAEYCISLRNN